MEKAREYRKSNPGLGASKLHAILKKMFDDTGCFPGRDAFIEMLRKHGLMVRIKRRRRYKTTDSEHNYRKYPNLIKDLVPTRPNQVWASDITYVETSEGVCYLSLITDLYSHKIVGWSVGPTLETVYPIEALNMAYKTRRRYGKMPYTSLRPRQPVLQPDVCDHPQKPWNANQYDAEWRPVRECCCRACQRHIEDRMAL